MINRAKFLRYYGTVQWHGLAQLHTVAHLRVEQIGPDLWGGALYSGCLPVLYPDGSVVQLHLWRDLSTDLTEEAAKRGAWAAAYYWHGEEPPDVEKEWRCCSDISDEVWSETLKAIGFPGKYPGHEGMARYPGF
jgi:hypothetical protein